MPQSTPSGESFDLLIIGGGITGAGAARDAARRGLRVCLVEQGDLASGTSSRSSKLVHGGLRYLENGEFSLVFEAVTERRVLMEIAPHLVNPLGFVFPVFKGAKRGIFTINVGMWLYDGLSLFRSPKIHKNLSRKDLLTVEPMLRQEGLRGAPLYYDCATDDARLTLETALDAAAHGAVLHTWHRVESLLFDASGRVEGVRAVDVLGGGQIEVRAAAVINATGPWTDSLRAMGAGGPPLMRPTKGVHLVVDAARLPLNHAVVVSHPDDGRVMFGIPWGERTYVGTTDTDHQGDPGAVAADSADVDYLLRAVNRDFPSADLTRDDVISTWAGVRPLIAEGDELNESAVSREHSIRVDPDGLITIAGGKLTTYRRMAAEVVDKAVGMLTLVGVSTGSLRAARTDVDPLPGAVGWPADDDHERVALQIAEAGGLDPRTARLLADTYGMRGLDVAALAVADPALAQPLVPGRPELLAQVDFAVQHELARTVRDVLMRRTQIFLRDEAQGLGCVAVVADRMGVLLGWGPVRVQEEVAAYRAEVERSRRWSA